MKELIIKKEKNTAATKAEFIADLDILFDELKNSYGGYEHFGEERFLLAKENVLRQIEKGILLKMQFLCYVKNLLRLFTMDILK